MRLPTALAIVACAALALPATASTGGEIVIRGADSGSRPGSRRQRRAPRRPRLSGARPTAGVQGDQPPDLRRLPAGRRRRGRNRDGSLGRFRPDNQKLPVPLPRHLGGGSDKMIANGEPDTCYSEGSGATAAPSAPATTSASPATTTATASSVRATTIAATATAATAAGAAPVMTSAGWAAAKTAATAKPATTVYMGARGGPVIWGAGKRLLRRRPGDRQVARVRARPGH